MISDIRQQPIALTIAGSDCGGGAGIQADLKTFTMLGVYGTSVITALTAQNTKGVTAVEIATPTFLRAQLEAVLSDIKPQAAKTGMLANSASIREVAGAIDRHKLTRLVVDPVMVSKHGHRLLAPEAEDAMRQLMLPRALLITPNLPEAEVLTGMAEIRDTQAMREAARVLHAAGARHVLVKGGHLTGPVLTDLYFDGTSYEALETPHLDTPHTHGTGCTLSAAIAAGLAKGLPVREAIAAARHYLQGAISHPIAIGSGIGPVNHLWNWRTPQE